ncbi:MAG: malonyl CoA-acyl carrier protein transacylase, partial [Castellaniella sp.]
MKIAFVFPGQGSQTVGMMDAWADDAGVQATLRAGDAALGEDLS